MHKFGTIAERISEKVLAVVSGRLFLIATFVWFFAQSTYMAFFTKINLPPDEGWHIGLIRLYVRDGADPFIKNQEGYFFLGDVTKNVGFLYHYLFSFLYRGIDLVGLGGYHLIMLRLVNVMIGFLTLFFVVKICRLVSKSALVTNIATFMLANTMMFIFLSGSISYDNLLNLFSVVCIFFLMRLVNNVSLKDLLLFTIVSLLGLLTKSTFAPLLIIMLTALVVVHIKNSKQIFIGLYKEVKKVEWAKPAALTSTVLLIVLVSITAERYLGNVIQYGRVNPRCEAVISVEKCKQYPIYVRGINFAKNKPDTSTLIPLKDFSVKWLLEMQDRTYGVFAHQSFAPYNKISIAIILVMLTLAIAFIRGVKIKDKQAVALAWVVFAYYVVLLKVNYNSYLKSGVFGLALQGRYGLPVLFAFYLVGIFYIVKIVKNKIFLATILCTVMVIFFFSCLPTFIKKVDTSWRLEGTHTWR